MAVTVDSVGFAIHADISGSVLQEVVARTWRHALAGQAVRRFGTGAIHVQLAPGRAGVRGGRSAIAANERCDE